MRGAASQEGAWTPNREDVELLRLMAEGATIESVARHQGVSERTVRRRLRSLADRLGVDSTIEAVVWAVRAGLI